MKMEIRGSMQVKDLKRQFHEIFDELKLEIFIGTCRKENQQPDEKGLVDCGLKQDGIFVFDQNMKVSEFESLMQDHYGLQVQIFRRAGKNYLETFNTDDWTLARQQTEAEASLKEISGKEQRDMTDRDQWE